MTPDQQIRFKQDHIAKLLTARDKAISLIQNEIHISWNSYQSRIDSLERTGDMTLRDQAGILKAEQRETFNRLGARKMQTEAHYESKINAIYQEIKTLEVEKEQYLKAETQPHKEVLEKGENKLNEKLLPDTKKIEANMADRALQSQKQDKRKPLIIKKPLSLEELKAKQFENQQKYQSSLDEQLEAYKKNMADKQKELDERLAKFREMSDEEREQQRELQLQAFKDNVKNMDRGR